MRSIKTFAVLLAAVLFVAGSAAQAATLVDTDFDGTEPMTVTYAGYKDVGAGTDKDTYDGWVWQYTPNIPTWPSQEYRIPWELNSGAGKWDFGWGQQELRLTQSFGASVGDQVTVAYQWAGGSGNSALDIDDGSGGGFTNSVPTGTCECSRTTPAAISGSATATRSACWIRATSATPAARRPATQAPRHGSWPTR